MNYTNFITNEVPKVLNNWVTKLWNVINSWVGGVVGVGIIAIIVGAVINHKKNKVLKQIRDIDYQNYLLLNKIVKLLEEKPK